MREFEKRNEEFKKLLGTSNRKLAMIKAALDGKSKTVITRNNQKLRQQLQSA